MRFLFLFGLIAILSSCPVQAQQAAASNSNSAGDFCHNVEQETFYLINAYRKSRQLPPFQWDFTIAQAARGHSHDMADGEVDFGHAGFRERVTRLGIVLVGLKGAGENVFEGDDPDQIAQNAVAIWIKSPPHLKNIRGDYNYSGLGVSQDKEGMIYFTQIFLKLQPPDRASQTALPVPGISTPFGLLATPNTR